PRGAGESVKVGRRARGRACNTLPGFAIANGGFVIATKAEAEKEPSAWTLHAAARLSAAGVASSDLAVGGAPEVAAGRTGSFDPARDTRRRARDTRVF